MTPLVAANSDAVGAVGDASAAVLSSQLDVALPAMSAPPVCAVPVLGTGACPPACPVLSSLAFPSQPLESPWEETLLNPAPQVQASSLPSGVGLSAGPENVLWALFENQLNQLREETRGRVEELERRVLELEQQRGHT